MRKPEPGDAGKHHCDRRTAKALQHADQGGFHIKCDPDEYPVQVSWTP